MRINNEKFLYRDSAWSRLADNVKLFNDLNASLADETYPPMKLIHVDLFVTQPTCCPVEGQLLQFFPWLGRLFNANLIKFSFNAPRQKQKARIFHFSFRSAQKFKLFLLLQILECPNSFDFVKMQKSFLIYSIKSEDKKPSWLNWVHLSSAICPRASEISKNMKWNLIFSRRRNCGRR